MVSITVEITVEEVQHLLEEYFPELANISREDVEEIVEELEERGVYDFLEEVLDFLDPKDVWFEVYVRGKWEIPDIWGDRSE